MSQMKAWTVWLNGKLIDTVFFYKTVTKNEVLRDLINHDNYPIGINIVEGK